MDGDLINFFGCWFFYPPVAVDADLNAQFESEPLEWRGGNPIKSNNLAKWHQKVEDQFASTF